MPQPRLHADAAAKQRAYRERQEQARRAELEVKGLPPIPPIPSMPGNARWRVLLAQSTLSLEAVREEMQAYHDTRSEQWQQGDRAEAMQKRIDGLQQVLNALADLPPF
jgi:hypothetical protein